MSELKRLIKALRRLFELRCPDCDGQLTQWIMPRGPNIYECQSCGKEWI